MDDEEELDFFKTKPATTERDSEEPKWLHTYRPVLEYADKNISYTKEEAKRIWKKAYKYFLRGGDL